jgi:Holliday junction DNA helicase RuvA
MPVESKILGNELDIFIYTHYTQQEVRLFGFLTRDSFLLFQDLITVSGVGPKSAVSLLNNLGVDNIKIGIIEKNHKAFMGNGVGLKISQKIVIELAGKYDKETFTLDPQKNLFKGNEVLDEVALALEGLGYSKKEIDSAIANLGKDFAEMPFEKIFRNVLNFLKKRN